MLVRRPPKPENVKAYGYTRLMVANLGDKKTDIDFIFLLGNNENVRMYDAIKRHPNFNSLHPIAQEEALVCLETAALEDFESPSVPFIVQPFF